MQRQSPKPLVEGALLAALAVILALIGSYAPVIGPVVVFLWPVPIALIQMRHGLRTSLLTIVVAGTVLSTIVGAVQAVQIVAVFGLVGLAFGVCFQRKVDPMLTLAVGSAGVLLSLAVGFLITFLIFKIKPADMLRQLAEATDEAVEIYRRFGMSDASINEVKKVWDTAVQLMRYLFPAVFVMSALTEGFLIYQVSRAVLNRIGYRIEPLPPFSRWRLPAPAALVFAGAVALTGLKDRLPWEWLYYLGFNLNFALMFLFTIHGMAVAYWFMENRWNVSKPFRVFVLGMALFTPLLSQIALWLGVFDSLFNYRRLGLGR